jgi:hypothetical protein
MKKLILNTILILLIFSIAPLYLNSQTCSCAATPLFDPIDYTSLKDHKWRIELTFKYHALNDLVEGTKEVVDDTDRRRTAQSFLMDVRYALFRGLTLRFALSFSRQYRDVGISSALPVSTNGLGDGLLTVQYSPLHYSERSRTEISIGGGMKMPVGKSDARIVGLASEDMQPGTGSWDGVAWGYISRIFPLLNGVEIFAGLSTRFNGTNSRDYSFGNEIVSSFGARIEAKKIFGFSLYARYRWADSDKRFGGDIPNTGGKWLFLVPGTTIRISKDLGLKTEIDIPIYRSLNGYRQFTSTYLFSVSVFYLI